MFYLFSAGVFGLKSIMRPLVSVLIGLTTTSRSGENWKRTKIFSNIQIICVWKWYTVLVLITWLTCPFSSSSRNDSSSIVPPGVIWNMFTFSKFTCSSLWDNFGCKTYLHGKVTKIWWLIDRGVGWWNQILSKFWTLFISFNSLWINGMRSCFHNQSP